MHPKQVFYNASCALYWVENGEAELLSKHQPQVVKCTSIRMPNNVGKAKHIIMMIMGGGMSL